jgi:hypothetical protein
LANYKRRHPRTSGAVGESRGHWLRHWPRWHDILFHNRPRRREEAALLHAVLRGWLDPDDVAWPLNHKPHQWYW